MGGWRPLVSLNFVYTIRCHNLFTTSPCVIHKYPLATNLSPCSVLPTFLIPSHTVWQLPARGIKHAEQAKIWECIILVKALLGCKTVCANSEGKKIRCWQTSTWLAPNPTTSQKDVDKSHLPDLFPDFYMSFSLFLKSCLAENQNYMSNGKLNASLGEVTLKS